MKDLKDVEFEGPPPDKVEVYKAAVAVLQSTIKLNRMIAHHMNAARGKPFDDNIGHLGDAHATNLLFGEQLFRTIIPGIGHALFDECWHDRDGYGDEPPDLKAEEAETKRAMEWLMSGMKVVQKKASKADEN